MTAIDRELLARIKARAEDPERRSEAASLAANSTSMDSLLAGLPPIKDPEMRAHVDRLQGMLGSLSTMFGGGPGGFAMVGPSFGAPGGPVSLGSGDPFDTLAALPAPATGADVQRAEAELGFELPKALRQLYCEVADGGFGPGGGLYSLAQLVEKYREMMDDPVGPEEQPWPPNLLPVAGADWNLVTLDRDSGRLVYFDAEELAEEDSGCWERAFKPEAESLEAWLSPWADPA